VSEPEIDAAKEESQRLRKKISEKRQESLIIVKQAVSDMKPNTVPVETKLVSEMPF
jgi:hypothetical protein